MTSMKKLLVVLAFRISCSLPPCSDMCPGDTDDLAVWLDQTATVVKRDFPSRRLEWYLLSSGVLRGVWW